MNFLLGFLAAWRQKAPEGSAWGSGVGWEHSDLYSIASCVCVLSTRHKQASLGSKILCVLIRSSTHMPQSFLVPGTVPRAVHTKGDMSRSMTLWTPLSSSNAVCRNRKQNTSQCEQRPDAFELPKHRFRRGLKRGFHKWTARR